MHNISADTAELPRYNIRAVERLTGVPAATLRSWERRYGFPAPSRTPTARRLYSDRDVARVAWVRAQTARGLAVAQAVQWARRDTVAPAVARVGDHPAAAPVPAPAAGVVDAAARYDEAGMESALAAAFARFSADIVVADIIAPALVAVGDRWASGDLPVSAEHFATHIIRRRLLALLAAEPAGAGRPAVVLACVPGEAHDLGLLILALFLRWAGAQPIYLGADVPAADLVRSVRDTAAAAVCLSATLAASKEPMAAAVEQLAAAGVTARIVVGGAALAADPAEIPPQAFAPGDSPRRAAAWIAAAIGGRYP